MLINIHAKYSPWAQKYYNIQIAMNSSLEKQCVKYVMKSVTCFILSLPPPPVVVYVLFVYHRTVFVSPLLPPWAVLEIVIVFELTLFVLIAIPLWNHKWRTFLLPLQRISPPRRQFPLGKKSVSIFSWNTWVKLGKFTRSKILEKRKNLKDLKKI